MTVYHEEYIVWREGDRDSNLINTNTPIRHDHKLHAQINTTAQNYGGARVYFYVKYKILFSHNFQTELHAETSGMIGHVDDSGTCRCE